MLRPTLILISLLALLPGAGVGVASAAPAASGEAAVAALDFAPAKTSVIVVKAPVGVCRKVKRVIMGPSSRNQVCRYRIMVLGHAFPKPKKSGYLQRVVAKLRSGSRVSYQGRVYRAVWKRSYRKGHLPAAVGASSGPDRYLVTCDTRSGYRHHHSRNNLVVRLTPA